MSYKHITPDQRNELSALKRTKIKQKEIAQVLGKNRTTIYREIIRIRMENTMPESPNKKLGKEE